ncbi:MAG: VWA domain-containing protein [Bdellovibrionales bacterium]|nr:VWA domain-containing protein [Bdellovibrionales bacterium]
MTWASPWAFFLIIPVILVAIWFRLRRHKISAAVRFSSLSLLTSVPKGIRTYLVKLIPLLKLTAFILAIFALARPQRADTKIKRNVEGIDIVLTLDISDSMLIEDMKPQNRMESAKLIIKQFIEGRTSDRIGLVIFSGESYTRVPLTLDYPLLQKSLAAVQISRDIKMGTAIGVALANAVARIKDSTAKSRVVILLTDGENNCGTIDPETALEIAKGFGIRLYTIGVGQDGESMLPVYIDTGTGDKIKRYRPIHSKVNDELLTKMAEETGGKYFRATTTNALKNVFNEINRLEKTSIEVNQYTKYAELFPPFLKAAVWLYLLAIILGLTVLRRVS